MTPTPTGPSCAAGQTRAGRNRSGTQRMLCGYCPRSYSLQPRKKGYPRETRRSALRLYADGNNLRRPVPQARRQLDHRRLRRPAAPPRARPRRHRREGREGRREGREGRGGRDVHLPAPKGREKSPAYLCTAVDRDTHCLLAWSVSMTREADALQPLDDQTAPLTPRRYFSGGYEPYRALLYRQGAAVPAGRARGGAGQEPDVLGGRTRWRATPRTCATLWRVWGARAAASAGAIRRWRVRWGCSRTATTGGSCARGATPNSKPT